MSSVYKKKLVEKAMLADQSGRWDQMMDLMKSVTQTGVRLNSKEQSLLCAAYKNATHARRSSWKVISSIERKAEASSTEQQLAREYREHIEKELQGLCYEILGLLDDYLLYRETNSVKYVCYLLMKGNYYRYLAEVATGDARNAVADNCYAAYEEAFEISKRTMSPTHPVRLRIAVNFAIFYYKILDLTDTACQMTKEAFDDAVAELDSLNHKTFPRSILVMQLLRDNLNHWTADEGN